jgi:hypothetical protein
MEGRKRREDFPQPMAVKIFKDGTFFRLHQWDVWKQCGWRLVWYLPVV